MNKRLFLAINLIWMLTAQLSWAGPLVFGPQQFTRQAGSPEREMVTFEVPNPTGTFWLQVSLGEAVPKAGGRPRAIEMQHVVTSGRIWLNGEVVAMPNDFDVNRTKQFGFQKDVTLNAVNTLEVELRGKPGNFISVEIRQAEPNVTVGNSKADLTGWNMGDQVALWWSRDDRAAEYVFYRATSLDGPWEEIFRQDLETAGASGAAVDGTPDARLMDLCYKVKALNTKGKVVRKYEPICVPKFMERQRQGFNLYESPDSLRYAETDEALWNAPQQLTNSDPVEIAASAPVNELCLSDDEFTDFGSMGLNDIQAFLKDKGSFLKDKINDVDEVEIELAQEIFKAAQTSQINPQVLLTTLQKEHTAVTMPKPLPVDQLRFIMGFDKPSTIRDQVKGTAAQFRRDFDRLSQDPPRPTAGGWKVGVAKDTLDPMTIKPASKAAAILYSYTPWVGKAFGGRSNIGGNALFCQVWEQFEFGEKALALSPENPTLACSSANPSVTFTAKGGKPPYTWSTTKGVITPSGAKNEDAVLQHENPNPTVPKAAYRKIAGFAPRVMNTTCGGYGTPFCTETHIVYQEYFCNDQPCYDCDSGLSSGIVSCNMSQDLTCLQDFPCGPYTYCAIPCLQNGQTAGEQLTTCGGRIPVFPGSAGLPDYRPEYLDAGFVLDLRTQEMTELGCMPCALEMQGGATVSVTDATGASASTSVVVQ